VLTTDLNEGERVNSHTFDTLTRQARGGITRRGSLLTLGSAALAATMANPGVSVASGGGFKKKLKKRCGQNKTRCKESVVTICDGAELCIASFTPCCDECFSNPFLICFLSKL
jgi:hypothetical protein